LIGDFTCRQNGAPGGFRRRLGIGEWLEMVFFRQ
jgi:hypothetical protein